MDAVEVALEGGAIRGASREAVVMPLFAAGDEAEAPLLTRQCDETTHRIAVIDAAILARHAHLWAHAGVVGELRLHQFGIDRSAE